MSRKTVIRHTPVIQAYSGHYAGGLHDGGGTPSTLYRQA